MKESEKKATSEICHNFYTSNKNNFGCVRNKKIKNTKLLPQIAFYSKYSLKIT